MAAGGQDAHAYPLCNCVVNGRNSRFPAHFLSFSLIPVGHWASGGAELGADGRILAAVLAVLAGR